MYICIHMYIYIYIYIYRALLSIAMAMAALPRTASAVSWVLGERRTEMGNSEYQRTTLRYVSCLRSP